MKTLIRSIICGLLLLAFTTTYIFAQGMGASNTSKNNLNYGISGGLNFANFRGNGVGSTNSRTFGKFGLFAEYSLGDYFAVQPEVNYDVRGAKSKISNPRTQYRLSYLEVPVIFKGIYRNDSNFAPYISAGPSVAFKLDDKYESTFNGTKTEGDLKDIGVSTNDTLFDLNFGAGVQFGYLNVGGRYSLGLTDIVKNSDAKNNTFSIVLGIGLKNTARPMMR